MKCILKQEQPAEFANWKSTYPYACYADLGRDHVYPGAQAARLSLRSSLLAEQRGLCCYCESRIDDGDFHVEHFRPRCSYPDLQLDYANLHACCHKMPSGHVEEHCGHKKADVFCRELVSPVERNCASHFRYDCMGGIEGQDEKGVKTIGLLNLDSVLLRMSRKKLIEEFEDMSDAEYDDEILRHLNPDANPLGEYYTSIEYLHNHGLLH